MVLFVVGFEVLAAGPAFEEDKRAGLLFVSGGIQAASYWLLETFPTLGTLG